VARRCRPEISIRCTIIHHAGTTHCGRGNDILAALVTVDDFPTGRGGRTAIEGRAGRIRGPIGARITTGPNIVKTGVGDFIGSGDIHILACGRRA